MFAHGGTGGEDAMRGVALLDGGDDVVDSIDVQRGSHCVHAPVATTVEETLNKHCQRLMEAVTHLLAGQNWDQHVPAET